MQTKHKVEKDGLMTEIGVFKRVIQGMVGKIKYMQVSNKQVIYLGNAPRKGPNAPLTLQI